MLAATDLRPHQLDLLNSTSTYNVIHGGVGTFKTTACIYKLWMHCAQHRDQVIIVAAQTYRQLKDVFLREWKRQMPSSLYHFNGQDMEITMPMYNSSLLLRHSGNYRSEEVVKGMSTSGYYIIQAESMRDPDFLDTLDERVRCFGSATLAYQRYLKLIDANPGTPGHFIHGRFIDRLSPFYVGDDLINEIHVKTTPETSAYDQQQIDLWEKQWTAGRFARMVNGEWVALDGRIYEDTIVLKEAPNPADIVRYWVAMDPGTAGASEQDKALKRGNLALVWIGIDKEGQQIILDEKLLTYDGVEKLANIIHGVNAYWGKNKFVQLVKDWAGGSGEVIKTEIRKYGVSPVVIPYSGDNRNKWFQVSAGVQLLQESFKTGRLVISPKCSLVIRDTWSYVAGKDGEPDKSIYDSHLLDALRYGWIRVHRRSE